MPWQQSNGENYWVILPIMKLNTRVDPISSSIHIDKAQAAQDVTLAIVMGLGTHVS